MQGLQFLSQSPLVRTIKQLIREGKGCTDISKIYGVHRSTINSIKRGDSWRAHMNCRKCNSKLERRHYKGGHVLMCGDSTSIDAVEKLMDGQKADMVFTDPPYGMNLTRNFAKETSVQITPENTKAKIKQYNGIIGDDVDFDPGIIFGVFDYVPEIFLWGADYYAERIPSKNDGAWIVWDKSGGSEQLDKMFGSSFELCWSKQKHKRDIIRSTWRSIYGQVGSDKGERLHPTQKPIRMIDWFFERFKGEKVVDLFGGSGSTLIACEKTNRKCFMSELDPHYVDVIIQRWMKYTGKMAYLIEDSSGKLKEPVPYAEMDSFRGENTQEEFKSTVEKNVGQFEANTGKSNA